MGSFVANSLSLVKAGKKELESWAKEFRILPGCKKTVTVKELMLHESTGLYLSFSQIKSISLTQPRARFIS